MKSLTSKQLDLYIKHGRPEEFADLVWTAANQRLILDDEARMMINDYLEEFEKAGIE